jgi:ABC-type glycerol-3-phosphate transport system permease component
MIEWPAVSDRHSRLRQALLRLVAYAFLSLAAAVSMVPFFWMISTSLMTLGESIGRQWVPETPQFGNYAEAWTAANFATYFLNSVLMSATIVAGVVVTSVFAAYAFARLRFFGRDVIFALLLSTLMVPETITMIPNFLIIRGDIIPLPGGSWLNSLQGLSFPFLASAFSIFLLRQFFVKIPWDLWDAARIDGAGHLRFLLQIVLPMSKAPLLVAAMFAFIGAWNAFLWPLLVTTGPEWRPLMVGLWSLVDEAGAHTQLIMAGATIAIVPTIVLYFITQKQFTEGIAASGMKE